MIDKIVIFMGILLGMGMNYSAFAQAHEGCYGYITEMIRSSNFPEHEVTRDKMNLIIDNDEHNMINAQVVYDVTPQPDNPNKSVSIGWIKYDIEKHILWNNSADLNEHPVKLSFNLKYADGFDQCRNHNN